MSLTSESTKLLASSLKNIFPVTGSILSNSPAVENQIEYHYSQMSSTHQGWELLHPSLSIVLNYSIQFLAPALALADLDRSFLFQKPKVEPQLSVWFWTLQQTNINTCTHTMWVLPHWPSSSHGTLWLFTVVEELNNKKSSIKAPSSEQQQEEENHVSISQENRERCPSRLMVWALSDFPHI